MPYHNLVPTDPSYEDMKKTVVLDKRRPTLPNQWTQSEVRKYGTQLISAVFEHSVLCVWEIYAWENVMFYIAVYGRYKP